MTNNFFSKRSKAPKKRTVATDQIQFRGNSPDDPGLFDRFQNVLKTYGGDRASILRALVTAYCDCVDRDGAPPRLPLHVETKGRKKA